MYFKNKVMKTAAEMRKEIVVSDQFLLKCVRQIEEFKNTRRAVLTCGSYSCTYAELEYAKDQLKKNGYDLSHGSNSYGVRTLIITF